MLKQRLLGTEPGGQRSARHSCFLSGTDLSEAQWARRAEVAATDAGAVNEKVITAAGQALQQASGS